MLFDEKMNLAKTTKSTTNTNNNNAVVATTTITNTSSSSISQIEEPVKIKHLYHIGTSRSICVDEDNDVSIVDDRDKGKTCIFSLRSDGFDLFRRFPVSTRLFNGLLRIK